MVNIEKFLKLLKVLRKPRGWKSLIRKGYALKY